MDHLPKPHGTPWPDIEVPIYAYQGPPYIYSPPWDTWAERQGYNIDSELYLQRYDEDSYPERLRPQLAAFAQSWLYFGVLAELLGDEVPTSTWIAESKGGNKRISTAQLLPELDGWCQRVRAYDLPQQKVELERVDRLLSDAGVQIAHFAVSLLDLSHVRDLLPWELCLSIDVLLTTLTLARNSVAEEFGLSLLEEPAASAYNFIADRMKQDGWCPYEIRRVRSDCASILSEYSVSSLGPIQSELDHSFCVEEKCTAAHIDHATYTTKHVSSDCECESSQNFAQGIAKILREGHTPLIRWSKQQEQIEVLTSDDEPCYVAISHVWSDGLGNLKQNRLPACQLSRLQRQVDGSCHSTLIDKSPVHVAFWIDTICVPVGEELSNERNAAIAGMKEVYENAEKVLVLNAELAGVESSRAAWELAARINRTSWFRRLWTLHEGVLAQRLFFQLADKALEIAELEKRLELLPKAGPMISSIQKVVFHQANTVYAAMARFKALPRLERSKEIWNAVHSRSTSNREDETICLSNMLGLDLGPILAIDRKDPHACQKRMQAFILHQKMFPQSSLFSVDAEIKMRTTLQQPGFRWAPQSFVFRHGGVSPSKDIKLAQATNAGLCVQYPGLDPLSGWKYFLERVQFSTELTEEVVDKAISYKIPEVLFMLPLQWDVYYSFTWDIETKWPLTDTILASTKPLIILEEDLPNIDTDSRRLFHENRRVRDFYFDVPDGCDLVEALVTKRTCAAIVVAAPLTTGTSASEQMPDPVVLLTSGSLTKALFDRSDYPVWNQLEYPSRRVASKKLGMFSNFHKATTWCVG